MSRHDVVKRHDFRSAMKSKEKLSSMKSVRFDGIYTGKEAEVGHGGGCVSIYIYVCYAMRHIPVWCNVIHLGTVAQSNTRTTVHIHKHVGP